MIQSGDLFFGLTLHSSFKVATFFWTDITFVIRSGDLFLGADITFVIQSCAFCFGLTLVSTFNIVLGADITFDVQRGVCFWPTFDQLFRHLISTSWVLGVESSD